MARQTIQAAGDMAVSIASFWEIAIKVSLGRISLDRVFPVDYFTATTDHGIQLMAIDMPHIEKVGSLPWVHRDPFDRLIVSQAPCEDLIVISKDIELDAYGVRRIWS